MYLWLMLSKFGHMLFTRMDLNFYSLFKLIIFKPWFHCHIMNIRQIISILIILMSKQYWNVCNINNYRKKVIELFPLILLRLCSKIPSGSLKLMIVQNPVYTMFLQYMPFHLKEALNGFSLAYLNCWYQYCCTLGL